MNSEAEAWNALRKNLLPLHPVRIENAAGAGTPDVNYVDGWIELKYAPLWPVRGGALKLPHYTTQQRGFAMKRIAAGGKCFVMLHIGGTGEWLLFAGNVAALTESKRAQVIMGNSGLFDRFPLSKKLLIGTLAKINAVDV